MTIYWHKVGPLLRFKGSTGVLTIEDLNPEQRMDWEIGRWQMLKIGFWSMWAAVFG